MPVLPGAEPFNHDGGDIAALFCHGFASTPQSLRPLAREFAAAGLTVRLPRLPGHGTTWQEMNTTRWEDWYAVVDRELRALHQRASHVVVVGLSMGAALATRLAEEHGPRIDGLVLVNPMFRIDDRRLPALPALQYVVPSVPGFGNDRKMTEGEPELAYDRVPLRAMRSQTHLWRAVIADLGDVNQPVLLLRSAVDHVVPPSSADLFLAKVGSEDVTDIVLHDSYHVATLDNDFPRIVEESLAFIERVTGWSRT